MRIRIFALALTLIAVAANAQTGDPDAARIVTEDIPRFWQAYDQAAPEFAPEVFQKIYLNPGTPGLQDFVELRIESAEGLAKVVRTVPGYYASARESTGRIAEMEGQIRESFHALKRLYPEAVFPDVYFLIGKLNSGGTTSERGLLIGAEMYGRTPQAPEEELKDYDWLRTVLKPVEAVPHIVAHELIHFQQKNAKQELLFQCLREGGADFLAEKISGKHINGHVHDYARPRERELWEEFRERLDDENFSGWLYGGNDEEGRPADLGYWMGYEIVAAYYEQADDKKQAIVDILSFEDSHEFLERSGYARKHMAKAE